MTRLRQKNLVSTSARNSEAHNDDVHMQVRQLGHEADARCSQEQRTELLSRISQEANQAPEDQREVLVTEVPSSTSLGRRHSTTK